MGGWMSVPPRNEPVPRVLTNGSASISCWVKYWAPGPGFDRDAFIEEVGAQLIDLTVPSEHVPDGAGICVFEQSTPELNAFIHRVSRAGRERIIAIATGGQRGDIRGWDLL